MLAVQVRGGVPVERICCECGTKGRKEVSVVTHFIACARASAFTVGAQINVIGTQPQT